MKFAEYRGYDLYLPSSGGKAGKGYNKTSTLQVRRHGCIMKQVRFEITDDNAKAREAAQKARQWIDNECETRSTELCGN